MNQKFEIRPLLLVLIVALAALSRLLPHPYNFTPVTAVALFGGAYFSRAYLAFLVPLLAMWISDLLLNNVVYAAYFEQFSWFGSWSVYLAFGFIVGMGILFLKQVKPGRLILTTLAASTLFFLVTNFASWLGMAVYSKDVSGLLQAYIAGLPFFRTAILGDLVYSLLLFGSFEWVKRQYPKLVLKTTLTDV